MADILTLLSAVSANTTGGTFTTPDLAGQFTLGASVSGTVSVFSIQLQGSLDDVNWVNIGSPVTSATAADVSSGLLVSYVRAVLSGYSGTGTVTATLAFGLRGAQSLSQLDSRYITSASLDAIATAHPPAASWSNAGFGITNLANGSAATDAMALGQVPQVPGPTANSLLAWSWDPMSNGSGQLATGGALYLIQITLRYPVTLSTIWWVNTSAAITPTAGESQVGIYSSAGTLVASATAAATATAMVGSGPAIPVSLSSTYAAAAGKYWVGLLFQATTEPTILRCQETNVGYVNAGITSAASYRTCLNGTGITTALPSSITTSSNTQSSAQNYWVGVS